MKAIQLHFPCLTHRPNGCFRGFRRKQVSSRNNLSIAGVVLAFIGFASMANGQTLLYFTELADEGNLSLGTATSIDLASHGVSAGTASLISNTTNTTIVIPDSVLAEPAPPSPSGGNYLIGPANGQGNLRDLDFTLGDTLDSNGAAPIFVDGQDYEIIYWTKPTLLTEIGDGEQWAYMPDSLSLQFVNGPTEFATFDVSGWSPLTWTEVRVPFTYSSATTSLSDSISIVSPSGTFQQIGGSGGTQPFLFDTNTRIFQMDYGVIPEPSTSALLVSISMMAMLRRSRR